MKKFTLAAFIALSMTTAAYAVLPAVIAKVNGKEVSKAEVEKSFSLLVMEAPGTNKLTFETAPPDLQKAFLDGYIEKMLVIEAAKKAGLQDDPEIKQKLKEKEEELIQQKFLTNIVMKKNNEVTLKKIYDEKIGNKEKVEEIHVYHILVKTEDEAKKIRQSIADGADFEKTAKFQSTEPGAKLNGGDLDYITPDKMTPEFSKAAFAMNKGELSQPVQTRAGWEIIKVTDKRQKKIPTFAEAKPALQKQLAVDTVETEVNRLKVSSDIEYFGSLAKKPDAPKVKPLIKKVSDAKTEDKKPDISEAEAKKDATYKAELKKAAAKADNKGE